MKCTPFLIVLASLVSGLAWAGPTILYVSESGEKKIAVYSMDEASGDLTRTGELKLTAAPGSLAISQDRAHLYAALRSSQLATITVDPATGSLSQAALSPAGADVTYLHVDKTGNWLLGAAYTEGVATVCRLKNGKIDGAPVVTLPTGKKAHSIQTDPSNRFAFVPHVGDLNKVAQLRFDATTGALKPNAPPAMLGGEGKGPRHMQFHPNGRWVYLVNEQGKSVTRCDYDKDAGTLKARQVMSTVPPDWDKTKGSCADIHVSGDGRFVYASNRGHDSLAAFSIDAESGKLTSLGQTPTEKTPRSFCLTPGGEKFVVSAGEGSNHLLVYRRDAQQGTLMKLKAYDCGKAPGWVLGVKFE